SDTHAAVVEHLDDLRLEAESGDVDVHSLAELPACDRRARGFIVAPWLELSADRNLRRDAIDRSLGLAHVARFNLLRAEFRLRRTQVLFGAPTARDEVFRFARERLSLAAANGLDLFFELAFGDLGRFGFALGVGA